MRRVLYALPAEEWRIKAMLLVQEIYFSLGGWRCDLDRVVGALLGYDRLDVEHFVNEKSSRLQASGCGPPGAGELVDVLIQAAGGNDVSLEHVKKLRFSSTDKDIEKLATESWLRLKNFLDDVDIRSSDPEYDAQLKQEMKRRAEKLANLISQQGTGEKGVM